MSGPGCAVGGGPPVRWAGLLVAPRVFRVPRVLCWAGLRRGRRPAREPSAPRAWLGASTRCPARPRRRPRAPQPGPPVSPAPFTPAARLVLLCVAPFCPLLSNFARNSPVTISEFELASLELQRFWAVFKSDRGKLRATFAEVVIAVTLGSLCRSRAPWSGPSGPSGTLHTGGAACSVVCCTVLPAAQ